MTDYKGVDVPDSICSVDECGRKRYARTYCTGHYSRLRSGRPLDDKPLRGYIITDDLAERLRFYAHPGEPDQCWEWTAATNKGYGMIAVHGSKLRIAHDVAWELHHNRSLPEGMVIRHTCDNPLCVNPAHLLLGTHADNVRDKVSRQRQSRGRSHGLSKLTEDDVRAIRNLYAGGMYQRVVAEQFGISQSNVSIIVRRIAWPHLV